MVSERDASEWFTSWQRQLDSECEPKTLRSIHQWLWDNWRSQAGHITESTNSVLRLMADDALREDTPHLFAGRPENAQVLFVNINPGWHHARNIIEDAHVSCSETSAWDFSRTLFTEYPVKVGRMHWWSQMIGLAWRIVHNTAPRGISARAKREWANQAVAGWELLPIHSKSAGILCRLGESELGRTIRASMVASLEYVLRSDVPIVVVASKLGASMAAELAEQGTWKEVPVFSEALPTATHAYAVRGKLLVAIPRQLASKHAGTKFDPVARAVNSLRGAASREAG